MQKSLASSVLKLLSVVLLPVVLSPVALLPVILPVAALAAALPDPRADESFSSASSTDGKKFIEQMRKSVASFTDYSVDSALYMYKPSAEQVGGGNFCWKKINLIKLTVKSNGIKNGSVVVRRPDGKIRAWGGPNLRFLKMNLAEDSRLLQAPNGYNALKSDFGSLLANLDDSIANGNKARVTTQPVNVPRLKQSVYVLQVYKPAAGGDVIVEQVYINAANNMPIEWHVFKDGARYSVVTFENFKANIGIDDGQFQI